MNLYIEWNFNPQIIDGLPTPNWYGLLFITGLILGYVVMNKTFKSELVPSMYLDKLFIYVIVATIVGARLGHVFFYDWAHYKDHPIEIFKVWEGGLASHGGAIALLIALYIYARKVANQHPLWIFDRISAPIAITGVFIRLANLANGEIVGKVTDVPWAFKFMRNDCSAPYDCNWADIPPRHPGQLYEAICYLLIFFILQYTYKKRHFWKKQGRQFGLFLVLLFGARFLVEGLKEGQNQNDAEWFINTGQLLSIPFVLLGLFLLFRKAKEVELPEWKSTIEK